MKRTKIFFTKTQLTVPSRRFELHELAKVRIKDFCNQTAPVLRLRKRATLYLLTNVNFIRIFLLNRKFLKAFDQASKKPQIPLSGHNVDIETTESKNNYLVQFYEDIIDHSNRQNCLMFCFEKNKTCQLCIKKYEPHGYRFIHTEIVDIRNRKKNSTLSHTLHDTSMKLLRAYTKFSSFDATIPKLNILGKGTFEKKCVSRNFASTEKIFVLWTEVIVDNRNAGLQAGCEIIF